MKVTFFANYLNPHTIHLCDAFYRILGDDFAFVASAEIDAERKTLGWSDSEKAPYEIRIGESPESRDKAKQLANESDAIIHGSAPLEYVGDAIKHGKLVFRHFERINKKGRWTLLLPPRLLSVLRRYVVYGKKNVFVLCASAYTAGDFALLNAYRGRMYKWGYFFESGKTNIEGLFRKKDNEVVEILWEGRFIWWKHPEKALHVARQLKENGHRFELKMIGIGEKESTVKRLIEKHNLPDCVKMLGAMPPEKVREHMERANIYLFTSNYHEGWGAVLNEAMICGCAVVASHAAGSTPYLIKHGKNGLVYRSWDKKDLYEQVRTLMDDKDLRERLGKAACVTLTQEWDAETAAERFLQLCEKKMEDAYYAGETGSGPCSVAEPIPQGRVYSVLVKD